MDGFKNRRRYPRWSFFFFSKVRLNSCLKKILFLNLKWFWSKGTGIARHRDGDPEAQTSSARLARRVALVGWFALPSQLCSLSCSCNGLLKSNDVHWGFHAVLSLWCLNVKMKCCWSSMRISSIMISTCAKMTVLSFLNGKSSIWISNSSISIQWHAFSWLVLGLIDALTTILNILWKSI